MRSPGNNPILHRLSENERAVYYCRVRGKKMGVCMQPHFLHIIEVRMSIDSYIMMMLRPKV